MNISTVFAALPVSDIDRSIEWFGRVLMREPDFRPAADLADYYLVDRDDPTKGTLQLIGDQDRAGGGLAIVNVTDIDAVAAHLAAAGIRVAVDASTTDRFAFATATDPDGNGLRFVEPRVRQD